MPFLPAVILSLLSNFAGVFTKPTWKCAQTLLIGAILCNGKRTVSSALGVMKSDWSAIIECYPKLNSSCSLRTCLESS